MQFLPIYILFLFLSYVSYRYYKENIGRVFLYILIIYTASSLCSVLYVHTDFVIARNKLQNEFTFAPFIYWILAFFIFCRPIISFDKSKIEAIQYPKNLIRIICCIGLILSVIPLIEIIPHINKIFDSSNIMVTMSDIHDDDNKDIGFSFWGNFCFRLLNYSYNLFMLCLIPLIRNYKENRFNLFCILIVLIVINSIGIVNSTRGVLLTTVINLVLLYVINKPLLSAAELQEVRKYLMFIISFTISIFLLITILRALVYGQDEQTLNTFTFLLKYAGEGFVNFNQYMNKIVNHTDGDYCFYTFKEMMGFDLPDTYRGFLYVIQEHVGIPLMVFYTFIGFFVIDIGFTKTILLFATISELFKRKIEYQKGIVKFHNLFLFFSYTSVVANGTCLYKYSWTASRAIIWIAIIYFILKIYDYNTNKANGSF